MTSVSRWLAPTILAAGLGFAALSPVPALAQSSDGLVRVLVDVADVVLRGNTPYYRNGDYSNDDRLQVERDRYGRPVYYRQVRNDHDGRNDHNGRNAPPYGNAYGYHRNAPNRQVKCNKHGKCKTTYYDPRHDRGGRDDEHGHDDRNSSHDRDDRRRHNDRDDD